MSLIAGNSRKVRRSSIPLFLAAGVLAGAAALATASACALRPAGPTGVAAPVALEYLGAVAYPANALSRPDTPSMGSLSGLAFDRVSRQWLAASDDVMRPRLAWLDIDVTTGQPVVTPGGFVELTASPDPATRLALERLDMESIVVLPDGSLVATNEGHIDRDGVGRQPALLSISRAGVVTDVAHPREHFIIGAGATAWGVRHNLGLESLTRTPDGRLMSGLEQPLAQDGPVSDHARGGRVRLVEFVAHGTTWRPGREWAYDLDPTPRQPGYDVVCQDGENGLSELYAIDDVRLIALERACLQGAPGAPAFNPVRLHLIDLRGAADVSSRVSLDGVTVRPVQKRLLLDLTTEIARLPPALHTLSNFEGIAEGPPAPDGSRTLLLVSDDNFRETQTLAFVWLKLQHQRAGARH